MIENVSVGIASTNRNGVVEIVQTGKGFDTKNYDYKLFVVKSIDENLGGIGIVTFSLDGYLKDGENPGVFNSERSSGRIIPKYFFPTFDIKLKTTEFIKGEIVEDIENNTVSGNVESWDPNNGILKIQTNDDFSNGSVIKGLTSATRGIVKESLKFKSYISLDSSRKVENGWDYYTGFLNTSSQVIQDGDYYQNFSYSLK